MSEERAAFERGAMTGENDSTTVARQRLHTLAAEIVTAVMRSPSTAPVEWQSRVFEILQRAGFDAGREAVILADQSVVAELSRAIAHIETLVGERDEQRRRYEGACQTITAMQNAARGDLDEVQRLQRAVENTQYWNKQQSEAIEVFVRKVEDLTKEKANLRQALERADARWRDWESAHQAQKELTDASRDRFSTFAGDVLRAVRATCEQHRIYIGQQKEGR